MISELECVPGVEEKLNSATAQMASFCANGFEKYFYDFKSDLIQNESITFLTVIKEHIETESRSAEKDLQKAGQDLSYMEKLCNENYGKLKKKASKLKGHLNHLQANNVHYIARLKIEVAKTYGLEKEEYDPQYTVFQFPEYQNLLEKFQKLLEEKFAKPETVNQGIEFVADKILKNLEKLLQDGSITTGAWKNFTSLNFENAALIEKMGDFLTYNEEDYQRISVSLDAKNHITSEIRSFVSRHCILEGLESWLASEENKMLLARQIRNIKLKVTEGEVNLPEYLKTVLGMAKPGQDISIGLINSLVLWIGELLDLNFDIVQRNKQAKNWVDQIKQKQLIITKEQNLIEA